MNDVSVIMSGYKRSYSSKEQYDAIKNQTYKNIDTVFWVNTVKDVVYDKEVLNGCHTIVSNTNYGVWGRFALALMLPTKYICIIDDDTIPGNQWIENCLETISKHPGVITTRGITMNPGRDHLYPMTDSYTAHGWCNPNEQVVEVDMGCHCWFFEKRLLTTFWLAMPQPIPMDFGEDMHLSFIAQKYFQLGTYVAPHPISNKNLWGSHSEKGHEYGSDQNAISWNGIANMGMNKYWNQMRKLDYKIVAEKYGDYNT